MATSKEFHDYIVECLSRVGEITTKKMMGEFLVYFKGKLIGDICDNTLFLKPTDSVLSLLKDAERGYPYEGSKALMVMVDRVEDTELMEKVLNAMYEELPEGKRAGNPSKYIQLWDWIKTNGSDSFQLTFSEIQTIAGIPIDHSFLKYKKELIEYGYQVRKISMKDEIVMFEKIQK